jgi:uncharacterized membrane protein YphA (DoxX/SURF4 family)
MNPILHWRGHPWIALLARFYLAWVFLAACWHKILDPHAFAIDVATYQILPLSLVNLMAIVLPWLELAAALMLTLGVRVRAAALLVSGMMVIFMVAIGTALGRGLEMSCGCFASQGAAEDPISWKTMARDSIWLAIALYILLVDTRSLGLERLIQRRRALTPPPRPEG